MTGQVAPPPLLGTFNFNAAFLLDAYRYPEKQYFTGTQTQTDTQIRKPKEIKLNLI